MYISRFYRINSSTFPNLVSTVEVAPGTGDGTSIAEVANTLRADKDSLDGVHFRGSGWDLLDADGLHSLIRTVRPYHLPVVLETSGDRPTVLDDLVGAGYGDVLCLNVMGPISSHQIECLKIARRQDCHIGLVVYMDPTYVDKNFIDELVAIVERSEYLILKRAWTGGPAKPFKKTEIAAMAKTLKGSAKATFLT